MMGRKGVRTKLALVSVFCALALGGLARVPSQVWAQEPTARPTPTLAPEWTPTPTETASPTITPTPTETGTPTMTATITPTLTMTPTQAGTPTLRPVTPISTVDRWTHAPAQPPPSNPGSLAGTPEILPVVGQESPGGTPGWVAVAYGMLGVGILGALIGLGKRGADA